MTGLLSVSAAAVAQEGAPPGAGLAQIDSVYNQCDIIRADLKQVHTSDSLMRVNIGQVYNGVSDKLMARLNSRLAVNRLDSTKLVAITSQYEATRADFASNFNLYDDALNKLLKIKCRDKPEEFYQQLVATRELRQELTGSSNQLNQLITEYRLEVEGLYDSLAEQWTTP